MSIIAFLPCAAFLAHPTGSLAAKKPEPPIAASVFNIDQPVEPPQIGIASFYHHKYEGRTMANGHPYRANELTCASWDHPLGTKLRVTYVSAKKKVRSVEVVVTDRGPAKIYRDQGRIIDLSHRAFRKLENPRVGLIQVQVEVLR